MRANIWFLTVFCILNTATEVKGQTPRKVQYISEQLLQLVPDIPATAKAFGRGDERESNAKQHAKAILRASRLYQDQWKEFADRGEWTHFKPQKHLPYLIAALAKKESSYQPIIRLNGGRRISSIPRWRAYVHKHSVRYRLPTADVGVMQVRAPSRGAEVCGVHTRKDVQKLFFDIEYGYEVGTCILTKKLDYFVDKYTHRRYHRMYWGGRPANELRFYGVYGPRKNSDVAAMARELAVIERYNWGNADLYTHSRGAGYTRRIFDVFKEFL